MQEVPGSCESENTCEGADEKCTMIPRWRFSHVTHIIPGDTFSLPDSYCVCSEVVEKVWDYQLQPVHRICKYVLRRKKCEEQKPPCKTESEEDCRKRQSQVRYRPVKPLNEDVREGFITTLGSDPSFKFSTSCAGLLQSPWLFWFPDKGTSEKKQDGLHWKKV